MQCSTDPYKRRAFSILGFFCNFDHGKLCPGISQLRDDKFDWQVRSGSTPSGDTGPSADHSGSGKLN